MSKGSEKNRLLDMQTEIDRLQDENDRLQQEIDRLQADKNEISQNASDYLHEIERLRQGKP